MSLDAESFSLLRASVQRFIDERLKPAEDTLEETDDVPAAKPDKPEKSD